MIQELFGASAAGLLNREPSSSTSPSSSTTTTTTNTTTTIPQPTPSDTQKLRCPRCDSSHTKFCYYNNYNLTQPRHFCKTCRRYWTKGGALRNVPIGGGCRKNKGTTIATAIGKPTCVTGKYKAVVSSELGKSVFMNGFQLDQSNHNPILWSTPPPTSHLLSLFRATQNPNPNPNFPSNPVSHLKDQGFLGGSHMGTLGFEPLGQTSSLGLCSSLWRNNQQDHQNQNQNQNQNHHEQHDQQGLRSSSPATYYHHDQTAPLILGSSIVSNTSTTTTSTTILDSAPVLASGELGFWNQTLPWSDLAAANGAYP